jgi:hypothetical protein
MLAMSVLTTLVLVPKKSVMHQVLVMTQIELHCPFLKATLSHTAPSCCSIIHLVLFQLKVTENSEYCTPRPCGQIKCIPKVPNEQFWNIPEQFKAEPSGWSLCNPSYSGGRDPEYHSLRATQTKSSWDPISTHGWAQWCECPCHYQLHKKAQMGDSSRLAQA